MNATSREDTDIWGDRGVPGSGEVQRVDVGPLTLWLQGVDGELWIAHTRSPEGREPDRTLREDASWSRWALPPEHRHLRLTPVFPDRHLVVKPDHPFTLMRRASARIYLRVPVWVRVESTDRPGGRYVLIAEIPTVALSDTWWGDFRDGELAYWLVTEGCRQLTSDLFDTHLVITVVQADNLSEDDLQVEKLSLRAEHLSIYEKEGQLWAEEVRVEYHGEDEGTEIHMDDVPPAEATGGFEISPARVQEKSFRARTFARLRALSGWGG